VPFLRRAIFDLLAALPLVACSALLDARDTTFRIAGDAHAEDPDAGDDSTGGATVKRFVPPPGKTATQFGSAVAIYGDALAVAAPFEDVESDTGTIDEGGATYLYDTRHASEPPIRLVAPNAGPHDGALPPAVFPEGPGRPGFPWPVVRVALDDRWLAVGVPGEDGGSEGPISDDATDAGAVYLYDRRALEKPPRYLKAPNPRAGDLFGMVVVLSGPWLMVGAPGANDGSGTVFMYRQSEEGGSFGEPLVLTSPNPNPTDWFGAAIALRGDRLVVGAPTEDGGGTGALATDVPFDDNSSKDSGAAYVYGFDRSQWSLEQYLKPGTNTPKTGPLAGFGVSVALSERRVLVGAANAYTCGGEDAPGAKRGAAYFFDIDGWTSTCVSPLSRGAGVLYGYRIAAANDDFVVGAPWDSSSSADDPTDDSSPFAGAVYRYRSGTKDPTYLKAPIIKESAVFGTAVDASSGKVAVGAYLEGERGYPQASAPEGGANLLAIGAVYVLPIDDQPGAPE
jgi:hypothetical protein